MVDHDILLWLRLERLSKACIQLFSKKQATAATTTRSTTDSDQEVDEIRLVDHEQVPDDCSTDGSDVSDDNESESIASDDDTDTSSSESSSDEEEEEEEEEESSPPQRGHQGEEYEEQKELKQLLSSSDELKNKIYQLFKRTRKLISMIHKSSILTGFVRDEARRKQIGVTSSGDSNTGKKIKISELVKDFHVRWNSTYLMLTRVLTVQQIVNDITYSPQAGIGLKIKQIKKLRSLVNTHLDWELLQSLANVLSPFFLATLCMSGRRYPTLALSYWIEKNLRAYLSTRMPEAPMENALRRLLLTRFDFYFTSKISTEQKDGKLVSESKRSLVLCSYCQVIEQYFLSTISRRENKTCLLFGNSVLVRISHYGAKLLILLTRSRNIPATEIEGKSDDSCLSLNLLMLLSENYWRTRSSNIIHTEFRGESLRRESCLRYRRVFSFFSLRSLLIWIHSPSPNYQSMRSMK